MPLTSPVLFDARWVGNHGIGRFARELHARLDVQDLEGSAPVSPRGQLELEAALWRQRGNGTRFFSPGFNAPTTRPLPFFFTVHDLIHLHIPEELNAFKRAYYERVIRPAVRDARRVFTVSDYSRGELLAWAGVPEEQVVTVYNGISEHLTPEGPRHDPGYSYALYVGNRKPHKNIPRLLAAFARRECQDLHLLLSGPYDAETGRQVAELGLAERVGFTGELSEDELAAHYRGAELLLMPSLIEGFGLPPLEAMACGTPVACADAASLPEVVGDAAVLFDPREVDAMTAAIDRVTTDRVLRADLRRRGLARAATFSWARTANIVRLHLMDRA